MTTTEARIAAEKEGWRRGDPAPTEPEVGSGDVDSRASPLASGAGSHRRAPSEVRYITRICRSLEARRWTISVANIVAAALFVGGCVGFYWPRYYVESVTLFLVGSVLFTFSAIGSALLQHAPSCKRPELNLVASTPSLRAHDRHGVL